MTEPRAPAQAEHLLPHNATALERALSATDDRLLQLPVWLIRAVWDVDLCPERLLPYLAHAWSLDEWDPAWSEAQKRQAIRDSIWLHQHKGTVGAMRRALAQIGANVTIREWFQYEHRQWWRRPYTFQLFVNLDPVTDWTSAQMIRLRRVAMGAKNVRSLLEQVTLTRTAHVAPLTLRLAVGSRITIRLINPLTTRFTTAPAPLFVAAAVCATVRFRYVAPAIHATPIPGPRP
jgi:phage tail P2-like protein